MWHRRKPWIALLAVPLLLVAAGTLYWYIAERNLRDGFAAWLDQARAAGWSVTTGQSTGGGWPTAATLTITPVALHGGDQDLPGGLSWSADRLILKVSLLHPGILLADAEGAQQLRVSGGADIPYTAGRMRLAFPLTNQPWPDFIDANVADLHAGGDAASIGTLHLHLDIGSGAVAGQPAMTFALNAAEVGPPPGVGRALGPRIGDLRIDGDLDGSLPPGRTLTDQAKAWRDAGGALVIQHLAVTWGPLDLAATATLGLDSQLQPTGTGTVQAEGYAEALDALAMHGVLSRSAATATKAVLSLIATNPSDGSPPHVDVPLELKSRTLSMRQIPLVRLPELVWP